MQKKEIKITILLTIIFIIIGIILFSIQSNDRQIKRKNVRIKNEELINLSSAERKKCIDGLIEYLNKEYYYMCDEIEFYNNEFDKENSEKYIYALVIGQDKSLIEITNLGDGDFKYLYIGNQLTENSISSDTGVSYMQIITPDKYKREKELEKLRENAKTAQPDATEMP